MMISRLDSERYAIIAAQNHPSGDPTPSADDREIIDRLYKTGDLLGITLVDSIMIGNGSDHSMREEKDL